MNTYIVSFTDEDAMPVQAYIQACTESEAIDQAKEKLYPDFEELNFVSIIQVQPVDLSLVMTAGEADTKWGLGHGTIRKACNEGRFAPDEMRKSQGTWLVTVAGMQRVYGLRPKLKGE